MKKVLKQVIGIDVAQDELVCCHGRIYDDLSIDLFAHKNFPNSLKGIEGLVKWAEKSGLSGRFVMEATGVYYEDLAYYLFDHGYHLSVVLPNKISNYMRTLEIKTVTDSSCSEAITQFGLQRNLEDWQAPTGIYRTLRKLTRERYQVVESRTVAKNQLHAETSEAHPSPKALARIKKHIAFLDKQEQEIKDELNALIQEDPEVKKVVMILCTIPGIGVLSAAAVLGETNAFTLIHNKKQLTSYAGLDVREKQPGTSIKGKPRISKKGNKYLRRALHFPALTAIRHDERFKAKFVTLVSKHGIKMKAAVAVQRKMLELMFSLFKTQSPYDKDHYKNLHLKKDQQLSIKN